MNVLLINQKLTYSSTTSYSIELSLALKERGHEVRICTAGGELRDRFQEAGIETYPVKFNFFSFRKLIQFLRNYNPDIVHVQNLRSLPMGQKIAEQLRKSHIVTVHHVPTPQVHVELKHGMLAGVIAVNEAIRESLFNIQMISKDLIRVVRTGLNLENFTPGESPLSSSDKLPVIGAIGRLSPLKGYTYLIAAARKLVEEGREAQFVIVGNGPEERDLRRKVKEHGLEKLVTFCPPLPDIGELIRNFDIVVVPTLRGGVGLTAIEAMAMARPVVASAVGELLHLIGDGETGLLVHERDSDAIAEKVAYLMDHPDEAQRLGQAARTWVEENFSLPPMVEATEQFYFDVLEKTSDRQRDAGSGLAKSRR
jgi:glycosyltransferase involved in cell wall biosynthesis